MIELRRYGKTDARSKILVGCFSPDARIELLHIGLDVFNAWTQVSAFLHARNFVNRFMGKKIHGNYSHLTSSPLSEDGTAHDLTLNQTQLELVVCFYNIRLQSA